MLHQLPLRLNREEHAPVTRRAMIFHVEFGGISYEINKRNYEYE